MCSFTTCSVPGKVQGEAESRKPVENPSAAACACQVTCSIRFVFVCIIELKTLNIKLEKKTGELESVFTMDEFLNKTELLDYNLVELVEFAGKSRLAQKV